MTAVLLFAFASFCSAQEKSYKELMKERKEMQKFTKDQLNEKVSKNTQKEAKRLKKEGWEVAPGALPIEKQLERLYRMQYEEDDQYFPKYIQGTASSVGGSFDAAKMQAMNLAKIELAGNIATEIGALVDSRVANNDLGQEEAASTATSVMAAKNLIQQKLGRTIPALEVYRNLPNKNKEVRVVIMYNSDMAKAAAKEAIREEMTKKADKLADQLDNILGY